ncbi:MAG TPA: ASCH domain-containing protein [Flavisolibacter sp.]|nr:ASCH domain-containing protein [Flavisolibacter sp.]
MKALSLLQPWASLVIMGAKRLETRSWNTAYRGELLIHASTGKTGSILAAEPPFSKYVNDFVQLPFGAIIGKVILTDIRRVEELQLPDAVINRLTLEERAFGDYAIGRYAWIMEEPVQFVKPVPVRGALGLWEYNGELYL